MGGAVVSRRDPAPVAWGIKGFWGRSKKRPLQGPDDSHSLLMCTQRQPKNVGRPGGSTLELGS